MTALNKTWHPEHFTCAHCNKAMSDDPDGYHEHESKGYCRPCYIELFAPYCRGCNKPIVDKICVTALNSKYHTDCFVCRVCFILFIILFHFILINLINRSLRIVVVH